MVKNGIYVTLNMAWLLDRLVLGLLHTSISRVYRDWSKKRNIQLAADENALLMSELIGEWADWFRGRLV